MEHAGRQEMLQSWPESAAESIEPAIALDPGAQPLESIASLGTAVASQHGQQFRCIHRLASLGPDQTGRMLRSGSQVCVCMQHGKLWA